MSFFPAALSVALILGGNAFAQIGMSFEDAAKLPDRIGLKAYTMYGEDFVQLTTEDNKGLVLEMDFLNNRCESARWILRKGKLPDDFAKEVWKANFKDEEFVKKGNDTWCGKSGQISQGKTENGKEVVWVCSSKMDKVIHAEAVRNVERKTGMKIDKDNTLSQKEEDGDVRFTFGGNKRSKESDNRRAFINYTDGTSGRVSSQGAVSDMYGQQKGWVNSSGFINYTDGTSGRISPNGAVYNMYGQQTGWAQGGNNEK